MTPQPGLLDEARTALHSQWDRLRPWVGAAVDSDAAGEPSVLVGWSIRELLAHLARAWEALTVCEPAPAGTAPLTLAEYLGGYAGRADDIAQVTHELAVTLGDDPWPRVEAAAQAALGRLDELATGGDIVVQARRAPVRLSGMAVSRVVELVVHADDLYRSVHRVRGADATPDPVDPHAEDLVARELLRIVVARGGWDLEITAPRIWIRLAAGRTPYDVRVLASALAPGHSSDSLPDLGSSLPLL